MIERRKNTIIAVGTVTAVIVFFLSFLPLLLTPREPPRVTNAARCGFLTEWCPKSQKEMLEVINHLLRADLPEDAKITRFYAERFQEDHRSLTAQLTLDQMARLLDSYADLEARLAKENISHGPLDAVAEAGKVLLAQQSGDLSLLQPALDQAAETPLQLSFHVSSSVDWTVAFLPRHTDWEVTARYRHQ